MSSAPQCGAGRPVWIAGSTHEGEEEAALAAHAASCEPGIPDALLMLVPRHPQRFEAVRSLLRKRGRAVRPAQLGRVARRRATRCSWSIRSANCRCSMRRPTSHSSAAAWCRSAGTTCSSPRCSACRCSRVRTRTTRRTSPSCSRRCGALRIVRSREELGQRVAECFDDPERARQDGCPRPAKRWRTTAARSTGWSRWCEPLLTGRTSGPDAPRRVVRRASGSR